MARFTGAGGSGGTPGPQGPTGPQGDSAYDIAVENGFTGTEQEWLDSLGGGGTADIADFVFTNDTENGQSIISLPGDKQMRIEAGADSDLYLTAGDDVFIQTLGTGDDIHLNAADDIRFSANNENAEIETVYNWRMDSEGLFQLPGDGHISNPIDSSGDPSTPYVDTIHLVPDNSLQSDQYIILDPTSPNHIHIRAGGNIDNSTADLILGGEKNNVVVSDSSRDVYINTRPDMVINSYTNLNEVNNINFIVSNTADIQTGYTVNVDGTEYIVNSVIPDGGLIVVTASGASFTAGQSYTFFYNPEYVNSWEFGSNGVLYGPAMGGVTVTALNGASQDNPFAIYSADKILLNGVNGEFLNDATNPSNQIATIEDVNNAVTLNAYGSFYDQLQQGPFTANSIQAMRLRSTDLFNDVTITGTNNSQITFGRAGKFNIAFSAQLHQTNGSGVVDIWLNKNGTPMSWTNTRISITANNPYYVAAWNFFVDAAQNDFYEIMWSSDSNHTVIETFAATGSGPTLHPEVPSIILTVNQVG